MAEIHDTLRRLLEGSEFQNALAEAFYTGIDSDRRFDEIDLADHLRHARGIIPDEEEDERHSAFRDVRKQIENVIQEFVIDKLPEPAPITLDELTSIAIAQLAGIPLGDSVHQGDVASAFRRFEAFALLEVEELRGGKTFDFGSWAHCSKEDRKELDDFSVDFGTQLELWSTSSGFRLGLWNPYYMDEEIRDDIDGMLACLGGFCSEVAMDRANEQLERVFGSIAKSTQLSLVSGDGKTTYYGHAPITFLVRGDGRRMLSASLSAYWRKPGHAEVTILDRLHNATVLLAHADQAGADPIALSLSFAAIEALVCEKDEVPVNKQIKRHVATLLVQDAGKRKAYEKVVGKLYDIRCQVMRGNSVSASDEASDCVRKIAAGVVRSVASWMANQE